MTRTRWMNNTIQDYEKRINETFLGTAKNMKILIPKAYLNQSLDIIMIVS